jgi:peroxiredoxin
MPEINRRQRQKLGYTYTFLSDPKAEAIRRYDLLHGGAGPKSTDIARPAEFLIDPSGTIRWVKSDRKHCCSCASRTGAKRI